MVIYKTTGNFPNNVSHQAVVIILLSTHNTASLIISTIIQCSNFIYYNRYENYYMKISAGRVDQTVIIDLTRKCY